MRHTVGRAAQRCPVELAMEVVGGKWKLVILEHLGTGVHRFGELQRALPGITARMLTRQLRELEVDGLVSRAVYAEVPPKVEYRLTDVGRSLGPVLAGLREWGEDYRTRLGAPGDAEQAAR
jgi:DNA-binding HxlR family transcriptional regulator